MEGLPDEIVRVNACARFISATGLVFEAVDQLDDGDFSTSRSEANPISGDDTAAAAGHQAAAVNIELTEFVEDGKPKSMLERDDGEPVAASKARRRALKMHPRRAMKSLIGGFDGYDGRRRSAVIGRQTARYGLKTSGMTSIRATCLLRCAAGLKRPRRSDQATILASLGDSIDIE